ncbi:hypothetical protein FKM82_004515 [Ascaphus truei]
MSIYLYILGGTPGRRRHTPGATWQEEVWLRAGEAPFTFPPAPTLPPPPVCVRISLRLSPGMAGSRPGQGIRHGGARLVLLLRNQVVTR